MLSTLQFTVKHHLVKILFLTLKKGFRKNEMEKGKKKMGGIQEFSINFIF